MSPIRYSEAFVFFALLFFHMLFSCQNVFAFDDLYAMGRFRFYEGYPSDCGDPHNSCYTPEELVKSALQNSMESKEKLQLFFQSFTTSRQNLGSILPQLNPISMLTSIMKREISLETLLPFIGFLFPSRWFEWQSSRYLREAEKELLFSLFANQTLNTQKLYYEAQKQIWWLLVYDHYLEEINKIIGILDNQLVDGRKRATPADLAVLQNIRGEILYEKAYADALSSVLPQLATALGLDPNIDWGNLKLEPHKIMRMGEQRLRHYEEFWTVALEYSPEIRNVNLLINAAKRSKRASYFDFLDPSSGNEFGYGFGQRIKIARSNLKVLDIILQRTKMELSNAIQDSLNNYNDSITAFPGIELGLDHLDEMNDEMEKHINDRSTPFDVIKTVLYFRYALEQSIRYINSYFTFRIAEAELNRFTWEGTLYDIVIDYYLTKLPKLIKEAKDEASWRKRFIKKFRRRTKPPGVNS